jgi:PelA/Pel-15E family pectate lyase
MPLSPISRRRLMASSAAAFAAAGLPFKALAAPTKAGAIETMKKASRFMVDKAAYKGGYVWSYLPDFSRRWGEMEAFPTMIWVQPPGTGTVGHLFLDAYHATKDEYYYDAACKAADALIAIQNPAGGWNYLGDLAGEESLKKWYDTIGKNGWRLEEFQHYYGNCTFDDEGTAEVCKFMLRMYVEKKDPKYKAALDKALKFVLEAQYPVGGWPQRYPLKDEFHHHGNADYTSYITFNDDVIGENIEFLIMVYQALGDESVLGPIRKAMDCYIACQQPQPQPAWGLQHTVNDLKPSAARTYEPKAFATHATASNLSQMMTFYQLTGDAKYLARIPEALDWLDSVRLPDDVAPGKARWPTFVQVGTGKPLYVHRTGSNVVNGRYYTDENPEKTVTHYSSFRSVDVKGLRARYEKLKATSPEEASKNSPLKGRRALPKYFMVKDLSVEDLKVGGDLSSSAPKPVDADLAKVAKLTSELNAEGWWPTPLTSTSQPYIGDGPATPTPGDFSETKVGDKYDTSPYPDPKPAIGISTASFIANMATLIKFVDAA